NHKTVLLRQQLLEQACAADAAQQPLAERPYWMAATPAGRQRQRHRFVRAREGLEQRNKDKQAKRAGDGQQRDATRIARAAHAAGVAVYAPWQAKGPDAAAPPPPWLPKAAFTWQEQGRFYTCPRGQRLELEQVRTQQRSEGERVRLEVYRCAGEQCRECPL